MNFVISRLSKFVMLLVLSWIAMAITHECGHLVGGMLSGATLTDVDLAPWRMPYSLHSPDPHPLVTLWAGPLVGAAAPCLFAWVIRQPWVWFIADFCLIANGSYLALAWLSGDRFLDTPRLLDAGAHPASIVLYCLATISVGYFRFRSDCIRILGPKPNLENGE